MRGFEQQNGILAQPLLVKRLDGNELLRQPLLCDAHKAEGALAWWGT